MRKKYVLQIRLDPAQKQALLVTALRDGRTASALARKLIMDGLKPKNGKAKS